MASIIYFSLESSFSSFKLNEIALFNWAHSSKIGIGTEFEISERNKEKTIIDKFKKKWKLTEWRMLARNTMEICEIIWNMTLGAQKN